MPGDLERQIAALAVLDEPVRRSLYLYVVSRRRDVGRDEAARAIGVSRTLAGFHLDRLVEGGLLETSFRRLSGRSGPGAGRPAKLYHRSGLQLAVTLPERRYELAARVLATAIKATPATETRKALRMAARDIGKEIGREARARAGPRHGKKRLLAGTVAVLAARGYEPEQTAAAVRLHNCPFHALASRHRELECGMNLALLEGVVDVVDRPGTKPVLDPKPGMCCVALRLGTT